VYVVRSLLVAVVLVSTSCAGTTSAPPYESAYSRSDLARFVAVPPVSTAWTWPRRSERPPAPYTDTDLATSTPTHDSQADLAEAHAKAGFVESRTRAWVEGARKGSSFATLFATADGAREAIAASEEFAHAWFTDVERAEIREVRPDGLGDDAWGVRGGRAGATEFVELGWRRGNVVFEVYVGCTDCEAEVEQAAREWAGAIDAEA
jgi:hypothetical protein